MLLRLVHQIFSCLQRGIHGQTVVETRGRGIPPVLVQWIDTFCSDASQLKHWRLAIYTQDGRRKKGGEAVPSVKERFLVKNS